MKSSNFAVILLSLAQQVFLNAAVALILFFLPIDVLFRLDSWTLFISPLDMVKEVAMMILLLAVVSASLALVTGAGFALVGLPFRKSAETIKETLCAVSAMGTLAIIVIFYFITLMSLLALATGITFTVGAERPLILLLVIGIFVVWAWKYGLLGAGNAIQSRLSKGIKVVLILIVAAGMVVAVNGIFLHDFDEIKANPIISPRAGMPNVILLSIDTLSAEDMSLYGYRLPTTPKLDALAKESYVFDNFFASSNWTGPTIASFISGLYPDTTGVYHDQGHFLEDDRNKNIGQALKDNGYQTAAIVANSYAVPLAFGISDSFSAVTEPPVQSRKFRFVRYIGRNLYRLKNYRSYWWLKGIEGTYFQNALFLKTYKNNNIAKDSLNAPELVFDRTLPFFNTLRQPNFIWAHILPPHSPYLPAAPFKYKFGDFKEFSNSEDFGGYGHYYSPNQQGEVDKQRLRYDEFILDTDSRVGAFLGRLKAMGRFDDSIIIITADHGESFVKNYIEHGGPYLHQPLIHIPLIVHLPGQKEGKRIPFYAGQVDLLPTLMDLLDLPIPKWAEGESLKAAILQGKPTSLPKFSMSLQNSRFVSPSKGTVAVMQDGWKLVHYLATGKEEFYHLASDPREIDDLASRDSEQEKKMRQLIYARFKLAR